MFTIKAYKANGDVHGYEAEDWQIVNPSKNANGVLVRQIRLTGPRCPEAIHVSEESGHYVQVFIENANGKTTERIRLEA